MKKLFCAVILFSLAVSASATTYTALTASFNDVSAAIVQAVDGDTVNIPAGTVSWSSGITISKAITVNGAGTNSTIIRNTRSNAEQYVTGLFSVALTAANANLPITFQNIRMEATTQAANGPGGTSGIDFYHGNFPTKARITSCMFAQQSGTANGFEFGIVAWCWGVVDHCVFHNCRISIRWPPIPSGQPAYAWSSGNWLYAENCDFVHDGPPWYIEMDSEAPSYMAVRYSQYHVSNQSFYQLFDMHGNGGTYPNNGGILSYKNQIFASTTDIQLADIRGGTGNMVYSNTLTSAGGSVNIRADPANSVPPANTWVFDNYRNGSTSLGGTGKPGNFAEYTYPHPLVTGGGGGGGCVAPSISQQPASTSVSNNTAFTLSVTASGTAPLTYWWYNQSNAIPGNLINGATAASYTDSSASGTDFTNYVCVVSNACGMVTSAVATVSQALSAGVIIVGPTDLSDLTVSNAIRQASSGYTIQLVGSGTVTWTHTIFLPNNKSIRLIGPGTNGASPSFPLTIISSAKPAIEVDCENSMAIHEVGGFKFQNPSVSTDFSGYYYNSFIAVRGRGIGTDNNGAYRIHNNYFDRTGNDTSVMLDGSTGELTGLVDHNTFFDNGANQVIYTIRIRESYQPVANPTCYGWDAWQRTFTFGSGRFNFIEDNTFLHTTTEGRHDIACDGAGGKYVIRYNKFYRSFNSSYQMDYVDAHGDGMSGLGTATRGGEIYQNGFGGTGSAIGRTINLRGGQWLVHDNVFTNYCFNLLTEYRCWASQCAQLDQVSRCNSGEPQCVTDADFGTYYPLPGQIRGTYFWANTLGGVNQTPQIPAENYVSTYIASGRDYFVSAGKPAAQSAYTPFTYPHPLIAQISPPATPIISVAPGSLDFGVAPVGSTNDLNAAVQNVGVGTLSGTASVPASDYSVLSNATYSLTAGNAQTFAMRWQPTAVGTANQTVVFTGGGGASMPVTGLALAKFAPGTTFGSITGALTAPFATNANGTISQATQTTDPTVGGRAQYYVNIVTPGDYTVSALVLAPDAGANSAFVNFDVEPISPNNVWDMAVSPTLAPQSVTWSSTGGSPAGGSANVWTLTAGVHTLIIRGREPGAQIGAITVNAAATGVAPSITVQPQNTAVVAGSLATFTCAAAGDSPLSYQWKRNGTAIAGATATFYSLITALADNASTFGVTITNSLGSVNSSTATLTVTAPVVTGSATVNSISVQSIQVTQ